MIKKILMLLFLAGILYARELPKITFKDFKEIKITREDYFDGNSLWGYINGGADLFLEYGFEKLLVEEFKVEDQNIKLEVWQMKNPLSAFGIYSVSHTKVNRTKERSFPVCVTDYQYQLVLDKYYISIINENGSAKAKSISEQVAKILLQRIDVHALELPFPLASEFINLNLNNSKFMNGKLGVQRGAPDWIDVFKDENAFSILTVTPENLKVTIGMFKNLENENLKRLANYYGFENIELIENGLESNDASLYYFFQKLDDNSYILIETVEKDFQFKKYLNDILRSE